MNISVATTRILLLIVLAAVGMALVYVPAEIIEKYEIVRRLGPLWTYLYLGSVALGSLCLFAAASWVVVTIWRNTVRKRRRRDTRRKDPHELTAEQRARETRENLQSVTDLTEDGALDPQVRQQLSPLVQQIEVKQQQQRLEIVAFGTVSSGKSSLLNALAGRDVFATDPRGGTTLQRNEIPWPGMDQVILVDTPGLGEVDGCQREQEAADAAKDADLVLLVVDGPLRDSEYRLLVRLADMEKRVVLCLNKEDWYSAQDKVALLQQIVEQTDKLVQSDDVVAVQSRATERIRVRVLADGREQSESVEVPADIRPLAERMMKIVRRDGRDLLMANLLLQSRGLIESAKEKVRGALDQRAWRIVDRYMWGAGGAAALSPFPLIDLAAGCAISTKMILDLARVYRQDVDVQTAVNIVGQQGKNLLAVLGTSVATPAVASTVASLIKTVPGVGTVAGGAMQGMVQALIIRWIGAIFIEYFRNEMRTPPGGLAELARREWERVTSLEQLRHLVLAARGQGRPTDEADSL